MHGTKAGNQMGVNTWAAFAGTDAQALVDGDFAMTRDELQPVLKSLRRAGVNIVAIHNQMTHEEPQYLFLHYWGKGPAATLARAIRTALDEQSKAQSARMHAGKLVFVCEHGAASSAIAPSCSHQLAARDGLLVRAIGRGTAPDADWNAATRLGQKRDGLAVAARKPTALTASVSADYDSARTSDT
jgi:hypothetical protein